MQAGFRLTRPQARSDTIAGRFAWLFSMLAAVTLAIAIVVVWNLLAVRRDGLKFVEETREARLADDLIDSIRELDSELRLPGGERNPRRTESLEASIREIANRLEEGPEGEEDPSREVHQAREVGLVDEVDDALASIVSLDRGGRSSEAGRYLVDLRESADRLRVETSREAARANRDLAVRVERLVWIMLGTSLLSLVSLILFFSWVRRDILEPLRDLALGARAFGLGRLDHRIPVESNDEVGELAGEFNAMADRLSASRKELEHLLGQRTEQFIRAARLADLGTFAAGVAHEVNTPLASIASCAEGLDRRLRTGTIDREEQVEYLQTIAREAFRAHEITARLLAFAREDAGPKSPLSLREPLEEVTRLIRHEVEKRSLQLDLELSDDIPPVFANRSEVIQVILNLLRNAIDVSPSGGRIGVRASSRDGQVIIEVSDQGAGIPSGDFERIFEPFYTTKAPGAGTGLGLPLASRIVEDFGGRIEVRNAEAGGAVFTVVLPVADRGDA